MFYLLPVVWHCSVYLQFSFGSLWSPAMVSGEDSIPRSLLHDTCHQSYLQMASVWLCESQVGQVPLTDRMVLTIFKTDWVVEYLFGKIAFWRLNLQYCLHCYFLCGIKFLFDNFLLPVLFSSRILECVNLV